jgi:hypothetical protein
MEKNIIKIVVAILLLVGIMLVGMPAWSRYQDVMNAHNQIQVNELVSQQTKQLIQNERQKAQIRVEEAKGIAEAQKLINATLTDQYLQHEAIEAQRGMANSPNHTQIYIPVGNNGIPLVKTVN